MNEFQNNIKAMVNAGVVAKKDEKFKVRDRLNLWTQTAEKIFDNDLNSLRDVILAVFKSEDPKLDLEKDKRAFANLYGKSSPYSAEIRQGLAETLAMLGNYSDLLVNCASYRRKYIAAEIVVEIFRDITWKRWASLSPYLELFAESAPDAYLAAVEQLIQKSDELVRIQEEEGDIFSGGHYLAKIVQSLEVLAWDEQYFGRTVNLLAQLASRDKGGNFYPRPQSSLISIFLPWYPQTLASREKRIAIAKVLIANTPEIGWNVISNLLPDKHRVSSGTHLPKWRKILPEGFENTPQKKISVEEITEYESLLLETASKNFPYIEKLVDILDDLSPSSFAIALSILQSEQLKHASVIQKEAVWNKLYKLTIRHRRHHNAKWAWPEDVILRVENVCESLKPKELLSRYKFLFDQGSNDLFRSSNYKEEQEQVESAMAEAIRDIYMTGQLSAILAFVQNIAKPYWAGHFLAPLASSVLDDEMIPSLLKEKENNLHSFLDGYLKRRFREAGEAWLERFQNSNWTIEDKVSFLCHLPFVAKIWHFAESFLGEREKLYWQEVPMTGWGSSSGSEFAVTQALRYNRPSLALHCLFDMHYDKKIIDFDLCAQALLEVVKTEEVTQVDRWQITQLIKHLQEQSRNSNQTHKLQQIEFAYLPLLETSHEEVLPVTLENALSTEPHFFHEVLSIVYRSEKNTSKRNLSDAEQRIALQMSSLLDNWRIVPGTSSSREFDISFFREWYSTVISLCKESGHVKMAKFIIGGILSLAPEDHDGLWINKDLAQLLNLDDNERMRDGFYNHIINARGAHWIDTTGEEDLKLAEAFHKKASDLENAGLWIFSQTLRSLARNYEEDARRSIEMGKDRDF